nr:E3 ubiquitin-protein ligase rnf8-B-like [Drosophila bipectinata]
MDLMCSEDKYAEDQREWLEQWNSTFWRDNPEESISQHGQPQGQKLGEGMMNHGVCELLDAVEILTYDSRLDGTGNSPTTDTKVLQAKIRSMQVIIAHQRLQREEMREKLVSEIESLKLAQNIQITQSDKQEAQQKAIIQRLNDQLLSMQVIISNLEQQLTDKEEVGQQLLCNLEMHEKINQELTIERDGMILQLEEQKTHHLSKVNQLVNQILSLQMIIEQRIDQLTSQMEEQEENHNITVNMLEEQISSLQLIANESQSQTSQREEMLNNRERAHLQEVERLQSREAQNQESITCSICLSTWEESGDHRVVSLACGHLYGDSCIRAALMRASECPICRRPASQHDLRYIFSANVFPTQT